MAKVIEITETNKDDFNSLAKHPLQSWEWGEFRKKQGHKVIRLGEEVNGKIKAVYQITFHKIPHLSQTVGYLPKSGLPNKEVINYLREIGKKNKAIFIKIEPNIVRERARDREIERLGLVRGKSLFTKYTSVIDLDKTEEELLESFKSKTRYNIKLAQNHGVKVVEDNSEEAFEEYLKLLFETTDRQGFYAHNPEYHRKQWEILKTAGISHLLLAKHNQKILAAFLLFKFNSVLYYPYGASTREHKELMAPTLLMWESILFGKKINCQSFDLWGDIEPNPPPNHPYFGFHRFKEGFSPRLTEFLGTFDLVINPLLYQVYNLGDTLRWKILRLKVKL